MSLAGGRSDNASEYLIAHNGSELQSYRRFADALDALMLRFAAAVALDACRGGICSAERVSQCILSVLRESAALYELLLDTEELVRPRCEWQALLQRTITDPTAAQHAPLVPEATLKDWQLLGRDAHTAYLYRAVPGLHDAVASSRSIASKIPWWGWALVGGATALASYGIVTALRPGPPKPYLPPGCPPVESLVAALMNPEIGLPLPLAPMYEGQYLQLLKRAADKATAAQRATAAESGAIVRAFDALGSAVGSAASVPGVRGSLVAAAVGAGLGRALGEPEPAHPHTLRSAFAAAVDAVDAAAAVVRLGRPGGAGEPSAAEAARSVGPGRPIEGPLVAPPAGPLVAPSLSSATPDAHSAGSRSPRAAAAATAWVADVQVPTSQPPGGAQASRAASAEDAPDIEVAAEAAALLPCLQGLRPHLHSLCAAAAAYAGFMKHLIAAARERLAEAEAAAEALQRRVLEGSDAAAAAAASAQAALQLQASCDSILDHTDRALKRTGFAPEPPSRTAAIAAVDAAAASAATAASAPADAGAAREASSAGIGAAVDTGTSADAAFARLQRILRESDTAEAAEAAAAAAAAAERSSHSPGSNHSARARGLGSQSRLRRGSNASASSLCAAAVAVAARSTGTGTGAVAVSTPARAPRLGLLGLAGSGTPHHQAAGSAASALAVGSPSAVAMARAREFEATRWLRWSVGTDALQAALDCGRVPAWLLWERRCSVCWLPFSPGSLIAGACAPALVQPSAAPAAAAAAAASDDNDEDDNDEDSNDDDNDGGDMVWNAARQRRLRQQHERQAAAAAAAAPVLSNQGPLLALVPCSRQHPVCVSCASRHFLTSRSTALGPWAMPDGRRPPPPEAPLQSHRSQLALDVVGGLAAATSWLGRLATAAVGSGGDSQASSGGGGGGASPPALSPRSAGEGDAPLLSPRSGSATASCRRVVDGCGMHCPVCRQPVVVRLMRLESPFVAVAGRAGTAAGEAETYASAGAEAEAEAEHGRASAAQPAAPAAGAHLHHNDGHTAAAAAAGAGAAAAL